MERLRRCIEPLLRKALATAERPAPLGAPPGHPAPPLVFIVGSNPAKPLFFRDRSYKRVGTRSARNGVA